MNMSKMMVFAAIAASATLPMAANAAGTEISLVTNGVTWRVVIDSSSRTATLGKDGWTSVNNLAPYRACDVNTSVTTDKIPWTFTYDGVAYTVTKVVDFAFFQVHGLTGILTIPDAVTVIGTDAFGEATGLTGLKGFGGVTDLGHYAFQGCPNMVGEYPDFSRLTSIGESPFINCPHMTGKLKLGESLPTISRLAFQRFNISGTAVIPAGVTTMGANDHYGVFLEASKLTAIWVKGKPDAASQTYTTVYCENFATYCSSMKMILMGKNTKGARVAQTAMLYGDTGV